MTTEDNTDPLAYNFKPARIILRPTTVRSRTDGQVHHVSAGDLAHLYGVPLERCKVVHDEYVAEAGWEPAPDDLVLHVRYDGKYYTIPPEWYA